MEEVTTLYVMCGRKAWHHGDDFDSWKLTHQERFEYVECYVFEKPTNELSEDDKELTEWYKEKPQGWIDPALFTEDA